MGQIKYCKLHIVTAIKHNNNNNNNNNTMKVKRLKHVKKHLQFYKSTFGFHEPYQVLVDLTFCQHALTCKINIREQINNIIGKDTQLFTTSCILAEGEMLGPQLHG